MPIAGLGAMRQPYQGGLGRRPRRRYAEGGPTPTPENLWNGAGAPEPGMIGYLDALRPDDRFEAAAAMRGPAPAPTPPTPEQQEAQLQQQKAGLEAEGYHPLMVPAFWAREGTGWVDDSGYGLVGQPNAEGKAAAYVDSFGRAAPPQSYGIGPPYGGRVATDRLGGGPVGSGEAYSGRPPLDPGFGSGPGQLIDDNNGIVPNWQDFQSRDTSTGGGFWTINDVFGARGQDVPNVFQSGASLPSTNNYRLLGGDYNQPGYIMRNGYIINTNHPWLYAPLGNIMQHYASGAAKGMPSALGPAVSPEYNWSATGWPGQEEPWVGSGYYSQG